MARYRSARRDLVGGGLAVLALGIVVAAYSVTGERIYDITYAPVFVGASVLAIAGAAVAAYGRAGPRTRAEPLLPLQRGRGTGETKVAGAAPAANPHPNPNGGGDEGPSLDPGEGDGPREVVAIECPDCGAGFREEGIRPFQATCPECGFPGRIPEDPPAA